MSKSLANEILTAFIGFDLPPEINRRFNILELLSQNDLGETFLLSEKNSGRWFVLKSYKHSAPISSESELLKGLDYKGIPKFDPEIIWDETLYTLREYVKGVSLAEYLDEHPLLDETKALEILLSLCDIVGFIHSMPTPIIHRDIKPSNIIINPNDNAVTLIDFGIARRYNENSSKDTTIFATLEFAPPEQFGFAQTDARTDIYAIGVLLRYMLTGMTGHNVVIPNKALERIIQKCTALDPKERYQSIGALKKSINKHKKSTTYVALRIVGAVLILILALGGYMLVSRQPNNASTRELLPYVITPHYQMPLAPVGTNSEIYVFHEPLIEAAVRLNLDKDAGEPITYGHLEAITEIRIDGMFPSNMGCTDNEYVAQMGNIYSLEDLRFMPNLQCLTLVRQPFYDLSPLSSSYALRTVHFHTTNISDFSPLVQLPQFERLRIRASLVSDWSELENMRNLYGLYLQTNNIRSISDLGDISFLRKLEIRYYDYFESLEGIQYMPLISTLNVSFTGVRDFSPLNNVVTLPHLERLIISRDMQQYLYTLTRDEIDVILYP